MKKIADLIGQETEWIQPSAWRMNYELRAGNEIIALLQFKSSFGTLATAQSEDGCWTFKRVGFFQTSVTIRACNQNEDIAIFRNNTWSGGGALEFPDGRKFLATTNFWQTKLEFQSEAGEKLIEMKSGGLMHISAVVSIMPRAAKMPELPLIVMLGWYLTVMMHRDAAAI